MRNYLMFLLCLSTLSGYTQSFTDYNDFYGINIKDSFLSFGRRYVDLYGLTLKDFKKEGAVQFTFEKDSYIKDKCGDNINCRNSLLDEEYFSFFDETILYFLSGNAKSVSEIIPAVIESNKTYTANEFQLNSEKDFQQLLNFIRLKFSNPTKSISKEAFSSVEWEIGNNKTLSVQKRYDDKILRVYYIIKN